MSGRMFDGCRFGHRMRRNIYLHTFIATSLPISVILILRHHYVQFGKYVQTCSPLSLPSSSVVRYSQLRMKPTMLGERIKRALAMRQFPFFVYSVSRRTVAHFRDLVMMYILSVGSYFFFLCYVFTHRISCVRMLCLYSIQY